MPRDQDEHKTQSKQKLPAVNPHQHPTATDTVTQDDDMNRTNSIDTMEEEQTPDPPDSHITCSPEMKWADIISTDIENERGNDKHGKKREQSKLTKDVIQDEKESDDNTTETARHQPNQTTSPKRSKKSM